MPKIEKSPDAKIKVSLENGPEVFTADDPMAMTEQLAKSIDEGRKYFSGEIARRDAELEQLRQQVQQQQQPPPQLNPDQQQLLNTSNWMWDTLAMKVNPALKGEALLNTLVQNDASLKQWNFEKTLLNFKSRCNDFPETDEASDAIVSRASADFRINDFTEFSQRDPETAANCLVAAHRACVAEGVYKPLTPEEQRFAVGDQSAIEQQRNPTAPPMLHTGNPEQQLNQGDPWSIKMDELRRMAINQQLGGNK